MSNDIQVKLSNVDVFGIDKTSRVASVRQLLLDRRRQSNNRIPILQNVNLCIGSGERVGLLGYNGSGKSSLLKVIAGIYPPASGKREVSGNIVPIIEMGVGFDPEVSGRGNILLSHIYTSRLLQYSAEYERKIIDFSGIAHDKIDLPLKYYSSGMQARLAFASSAFQTPDVLLVDEVFATGDKQFIQKSKQHMLDMINNTKISIIVSHDTKLIRDLTTRCILLQSGRIIADGKTDEIISLFEREATV